MNTTTFTLQNQVANQSTPVKIKRLSSVEEELADRICRAENGKSILAICRELAGMLTETYSRNQEDLGDLRDALCHRLKQSLKCHEIHALQLIELSLDLVHARIQGTYRRNPFESGNQCFCYEDILPIQKVA